MERKIRVTVAGPVSNDYETYQVKNHPDTVDLGVKLVMGAPFPRGFQDAMHGLIEEFESCFRPYDVVFHEYATPNLSATVSTLVRAPFDPKKYNRDQEAMTQEQQEMIESKFNPNEVEEAVRATPPFHLDFVPWFVKIDRRGEILLLGVARGENGTEPLAELRRRILETTPDAFREKGSDFYIVLAAIQGFHTLDGLQKRAVRNAMLEVVESLPCPNALRIDRMKMVRYRHRSLARLDQGPDCETEIELARKESVGV